jgi:hypothetical protein
MMQERTRRQRIKDFLSKKKIWTSTADIYAHLHAVSAVEKTAIRVMLQKGLGQDFIRHSKYKGFYKAI